MLDRHSEIIAHFIGQFDQIAEQSLYRLHYDAFQAQHRSDREPGALLEINVRVASDLLEDRHAAGRVRLAEETPAPRIIPADLDGLAGHAPLDPGLLAPTLSSANVVAFVFDHPAPFWINTIWETPVFELSPPGGVITFAYQQNIAQDNDILLTRPLELSPDLAASRTDAALEAELAGLAAAADTLTPGDFTLARKTEDITTRTETLREAFAGVDPETVPEGATVTIVSKNAGTLPESGILVDGAAAETVPSALEEALDDRGYGATDATDDADDDADDNAGAEGGAAGESGVVIGSVEIGPGATGPHTGAPQTIETGGNLLMNNTVSNLTPVDASLIAVAGQAMSYTFISQVNVLGDRDTLIGPDAGVCTGKDHLFKAASSEGHNIARVSWEGSARPEAGGDGAPLGFGITEIAGDLVLTTHVFQLNLITDNDVITFQTTFHQVEISTGGNVLVNVMSEFSFQNAFDMILVAGDMLSLVSLSQLNLLFDNDLVVDGDGAGGTVETGGNLLWNEAQITWHGIDTTTDQMSEAAGAALKTMAGGQLDVDTLKSEPLLAGKEVPLLLTIGGNLVLDYRLEQINILADADTVQVFANAALADGFTRVDVSTGDNLLANVARLDIHGTDSTIMAAGGAFSDLVIHQAGMYDTDDTPLELASAGSALASEAVVFLADGMIDDGAPGVPGGGDVFVDIGGGSGTFDTLGGVVA